MSEPLASPRTPPQRRYPVSSVSARVVEGSSQFLQAPPTMIEDRDLLHAHLMQPLHRPLILPAELVGKMGVTRQRHRTPGLQAELQQPPRRIDLADRLAQACRRDLDRHVGRRNPLHGPLVEATRLRGNALAPDLHQVRVREGVEQAALRRLAERLEVAPPYLLGVGRAPDVELAPGPLA